MSAHDEPEVRIEAAEVGAVAFLGKPFDDGSLLNALFFAFKITTQRTIGVPNILRCRK